MRVVPCLALVAATLAGCSEDLGTCQMDAATQVVYASDGTPYYAGQGLVQYGCASGVCHSVYAEHDSRRGAPFELNFDLGPLSSSSSQSNVSALRNGLAKVHDSAGEMWGEISAGTMPPGKAGERPDQAWKTADGKEAGLPGLSTDTGKATVRNWLACGAPVVSGVTGAVADATSLGKLVDPAKGNASGVKSFDDIYASIFQSCGATCHNPSVIKVGLDFTSKAMTLATLVDKSPHSGDGAMCSTQPTKLLVAGNCKDSLVYQKLTATPPCGDRMPVGQPLPDSTIQALCDWIDAGAKE
jgi:hypothetical protein